MEQVYSNNTYKRVYFKETDAGGVVYFGNMSRYIEIGFSEWFREFAIPLNELYKENDLFMVVKRTEQNFNSSLKYDDMLCIRTTLVKVKNFSMKLKTEIYVEDKLYYDAVTELVPVNHMTKRISRVPEALNKYID